MKAKIEETKEFTFEQVVSTPDVLFKLIGKKDYDPTYVPSVDGVAVFFITLHDHNSMDNLVFWLSDEKIEIADKKVWGNRKFTKYEHRVTVVFGEKYETPDAGIDGDSPPMGGWTRKIPSWINNVIP